MALKCSVNAKRDIFQSIVRSRWPTLGWKMDSALRGSCEGTAGGRPIVWKFGKDLEKHQIEFTEHGANSLLRWEIDTFKLIFNFVYFVMLTVLWMCFHPTKKAMMCNSLWKRHSVKHHTGTFKWCQKLRWKSEWTKLMHTKVTPAHPSLLKMILLSFIIIIIIKITKWNH